MAAWWRHSSEIQIKSGPKGLCSCCTQSLGIQCSLSAHMEWTVLLSENGWPNCCWSSITSSDENIPRVCVLRSPWCPQFTECINILSVCFWLDSGNYIPHSCLKVPHIAVPRAESAAFRKPVQASAAVLWSKSGSPFSSLFQLYLFRYAVLVMPLSTCWKENIWKTYFTQPEPVSQELLREQKKMDTKYPLCFAHA